MKYSRCILALCALFAAACGEMVMGNGVAKTEPREVANFAAIELKGSLAADVTFGEAFSVTVSGDENIVPLVSTTVTGDVLQISTKGSFATKQGLRVAIVMPKLTSLKREGSGKAVVQSVRADALKLEVSGAGSIEISGEAASASIEISGAGKVIGRAFTAGTADATVRGAGTLELAVITRLVAKVSGAGSVRYLGPVADVVSEVKGAGSVKRLE